MKRTHRGPAFGHHNSALGRFAAHLKYDQSLFTIVLFDIDPEVYGNGQPRTRLLRAQRSNLVSAGWPMMRVAARAAAKGRAIAASPERPQGAPATRFVRMAFVGVLFRSSPSRL
jgi:hypothetical protein